MTSVKEAFDLSGKVSLITGGTEGIGLGIAKVLGDAGSRIAVTSRRAEAVAKRASELSDTGLQCMGVAADVCDPDSVQGLVSEVTAKWGRIDILVNCAGGSFGDRFNRGPLFDLTDQDFIEAYRLNVVGAHTTTKAVSRSVPDWEGAVVNVGSIGGVRAGKNMGAYGAAKAGLLNLTQSMAGELAPKVRVNAVVVGHIDTPRVSAKRTGERLQGIMSGLAMQRMGTPEDVAYGVLFLASPASSWVTGSMLTLDGGEHIFG